MDNMPRLQLSKYRNATQRFYNHAFALLDVTPQQIKVSYYEYPSWDPDAAPPEPELGPPIFVEVLLPAPTPAGSARP